MRLSNSKDFHVLLLIGAVDTIFRTEVAILGIQEPVIAEDRNFNSSLGVQETSFLSRGNLSRQAHVPQNPE